MIRGLDSKQEQSVRQLARDTRPLGVRMGEALAKPEVMFMVSGASMFVRDARQLALVDPARRVAPTEVRVTGIVPQITSGLAAPETAGRAVL